MSTQHKEESALEMAVPCTFYSSYQSLFLHRCLSDQDAYHPPRLGLYGCNHRQFVEVGFNICFGRGNYSLDSQNSRLFDRFILE